MVDNFQAFLTLNVSPDAIKEFFTLDDNNAPFEYIRQRSIPVKKKFDSINYNFIIKVLHNYNFEQIYDQIGEPLLPGKRGSHFDGRALDQNYYA